MNAYSSVEVPINMVGKKPELIAAYVAIRLSTDLTEIDWTVSKIAKDLAKMDEILFRLSLLHLRAVGMLRIRGGMHPMSIFEDADNLGMVIIDRQLSFSDLLTFDPYFVDFLQLLIKEEKQIKDYIRMDASKQEYQSRLCALEAMTADVKRLLRNLGMNSNAFEASSHTTELLH